MWVAVPDTVLQQVVSPGYAGMFTTRHSQLAVTKGYYYGSSSSAALTNATGKFAVASLIKAVRV